MSTFRVLFFSCIFSFCCNYSLAQSSINTTFTNNPIRSVNKAIYPISNFSFSKTTKGKKLFEKYFNSSSKRSDNLNKRIERTNRKYLKKYFKEENKLHKKLCKIDPALADNLFSINNDPLFYHQNDKNIIKYLENRSAPTEYFPQHDSLKTALSFLNAKNKKLSGIDSLKSSDALLKSLNLDTNLLNSSRLQGYFRERKLNFNESLIKYPELKNNYVQIDKLNFYYHEQISEYKNMFGDLSNIDEKVLKILSGNSEFKKLLANTGQLSAFSAVPQDWGKSIEGLQTIIETKGIMNTSIADLGSEAKNVVEQNMKPMMTSVEKLKSGDYGNISNAADIPSFKPSALKTKPFANRLSSGYNFQLNQSNYGFPATATTGLQVDYKLTSKIKPGIGVSYILGMGSGWDNINFTQQGIGLRSFVDYKISNILYISGGYERNYLPPSNQKKELGIKNWNWRKIAFQYRTTI